MIILGFVLIVIISMMILAIRFGPQGERMGRTVVISVTKIMNKLQRRIIDISYKYKLSHISSCISTVDTIDQIYGIRKKDEPFVLSNGHAALALYVVLEKYEKQDAEKLWKKHGTHPNRDMGYGFWDMVF